MKLIERKLFILFIFYLIAIFFIVYIQHCEPEEIFPNSENLCRDERSKNCHLLADSGIKVI